MLTYHPTHSRVLLQENAPPETSLVIVPDTVINPLNTWLVLAIGADVKCCALGDNVLILPNAHVLGIDREKRIGLIQADAIIAVVRNEPEVHLN